MHQTDATPQISGLKREPLVLFVCDLWRRRSWLALITAIGISIAVAVAFIIPKRYESTVRLMPPDAQSLSSSSLPASLAGAALSGGASTLAGGLLGSKTPGTLFLGILESRTVQDDLIDRFDLRRVYGAGTYASARKKLTKSSLMEEDKKGMIDITVTDGDPRRARDMAAAYVEELNKLVTQLNTSSAHRERVFLEERLKAIKQDLDTTTKELSGFSSRNATFDMPSQGKAIVEAMAKLQGELIAAETELRGLQSMYADDSAQVRMAQAKIEELRRQLRKMGGGADESGAGLKAGELSPSMRQLPLLGATYSDLYRQVSMQEAIYEALTKQYEMAKVQEVKDTPSVKVLDPADLPERQSYPPRGLIVLLGALSSLGIGVLYVIGQCVWRETDEAHPAKAAVRAIASGFRV